MEVPAGVIYDVPAGTRLSDEVCSVTSFVASALGPAYLRRQVLPQARPCGKLSAITVARDIVHFGDERLLHDKPV